MYFIHQFDEAKRPIWDKPSEKTTTTTTSKESFKIFIVCNKNIQNEKAYNTLDKDFFRHRYF